MEMNFWTAVVIIVAIAAFANIRMTKYRTEAGRRLPSEPVQPLASQREAELLREVEDLRERVKVLERIATDSRSTAALAHEIENLRERKD